MFDIQVGRGFEGLHSFPATQEEERVGVQLWILDVNKSSQKPFQMLVLHWKTGRASTAFFGEAQGSVFLNMIEMDETP